MSMLYIMVPVALALAFSAVLAFIWAVKSGQFDDPKSQAYRMLFDDEASNKGEANNGDRHDPPA